jgi:hypothetical protein
MFVYVDDIRNPKNNNLYIIRHYQDCIDLLTTDKIDFISLDHDLGEEKTGYDIVKFIVKEGIKIPHINIHSANPVGRDNMKQLIERYFPKTLITFDTKI